MPLDPLILSIDTSTAVCSVALHKAGKILVNQESNIQNAHGENLALMIEQLFAIAKIEAKDISAVAITKGPGSYTGLRISSSTAKGLCFALDIPLIAISTLRLIAEDVLLSIDKETLICPMIDARRMEVYTAIYDTDGNEILKEQPLVLTEYSFKEFIQNHKMLFIGNGSQKFAELVQHPNLDFIPNIDPLAKHMGGLAYDIYLKGKFEDVAYFEPDYLKEFYTTAKKVDRS